MTRLRLLLAALLLALAPAAHGQTVAVEPGWLRSDDASAPGVRFDLAAGGERVRDAAAGAAWITTAGALRGALALDPDANPEALVLHARVGWLQAFYRPGTAPADPDAPPVGGYDRGSLELALAATAEADQRFDEATAAVGARVGYVAPNAAVFLSAGPRIALAYAGVVPLASAARPDDGADGGADLHGRLDLTAEWHPFLGATPLRLHLTGRAWRTHGADAAARAALGDGGVHGSVALALAPTAWRLHRLAIQEVFVRWTGGDLPTAPDAARAWMVGLRAGL